MKIQLTTIFSLFICLCTAQTPRVTLVSTVVSGDGSKKEASIEEFPQIVEKVSPLLNLYLQQKTFPNLSDTLASRVKASLVTVIVKENTKYSYDTLDDQTIVRHGSYDAINGTGIIVGYRYNKEQGKWFTIIVTCKHCIGEKETTIEYTGVIKKAIVPIQAFNPHCDFGIVIVEDSLGKALPLAQLGGYEIVYCYNFEKKTEKGISTMAVLCHTPEGRIDPTIINNGLNGERAVALKIRHGYSGGPVVNARGELVGLCQGHNGTGKGGYELGYIIETSTFIKLLNASMIILDQAMFKIQ